MKPDEKKVILGMGLDSDGEARLTKGDNFFLVGGTQDNSTQHGPSRTTDVSGIRNSDWRIVIGGDGHDCAIDPENPDIIYAESQNGFLRRYDRRTGESTAGEVPRSGPQDRPVGDQ